MTDARARQLKDYGVALAEYLRVACSQSARVVILTNAASGWVEECVRFFVPDAQPLFEKGSGGPRVVYAREVYQKVRRRNAGCVRHVQNDSPAGSASPLESADELTAWKYVAMRREAKRFYAKYPTQTWKNIVSIGDSRYERDAVQDVAFRRVGPAREKLRVKLCVCPSCPSLHDLTCALVVDKVLLAWLVRHDGDLDIDLNGKRNRCVVFAEALDMPDLGNLNLVIPGQNCCLDGLLPGSVPVDGAACSALDHFAVIVRKSYVA